MPPSVQKGTPRIPKVDLQIVTNGRTRNIGTYYPDEGVWRKHVRLVHLARIAGMTPGWDAATFDRLLRDYEGFNSLQAINDDTGGEYTATVEDIQKHGFRKTFGTYGEQVFMEMVHWRVATKGQLQLKL